MKEKEVMAEPRHFICSICADCRYALVFKKDYLSYKCVIERLITSKDWRSEDLPYLIACSYYELKKIRK